MARNFFLAKPSIIHHSGALLYAPAAAAPRNVLVNEILNLLVILLKVIGKTNAPRPISDNLIPVLCEAYAATRAHVEIVIKGLECAGPAVDLDRKFAAAQVWKTARVINKLNYANLCLCYS